MFSRTPSSRAASPAFGGFTLIEMLVAMTIFFMAIGILSSAVTQALRLSEIDRNEAMGVRDGLMRLGWFRETVGLATMPSFGNGEPFKGNATAMSGTTLRSLDAANTGPGAFSWTIAFKSERGESELRYLSSKNSPSGVFSWAGSQGRFRYLDDAGRWVDRWPADERADATSMPLAVMFEYGAEQRVVLAAVQNRSLPPPSMKELQR